MTTGGGRRRSRGRFLARHWFGGEKTEIPQLNPARRSTSKKKIKEKEEIRTLSTQDLENKQMASKVRLALTSSGAVAGEDVRR
jgi:hypothetical protein